MSRIRWWSSLLRALATIVVALAAWILLGYFASAPLGAIYGWSGHPPIPAAPRAVYIGLFLVVLPVGCLLGAWTAIRWIEAAIRRLMGSGSTAE